jgi:hypothetical protein
MRQKTKDKQIREKTYDTIEFTDTGLTLMEKNKLKYEDVEKFKGFKK